VTQSAFVCFVCVFQNKLRSFPYTLQLIGSYNRDDICLQRGKKLIFKLIQIYLILKKFKREFYTQADKL
jgi:hypothetical protein